MQVHTVRAWAPSMKAHQNVWPTLSANEVYLNNSCAIQEHGKKATMTVRIRLSEYFLRDQLHQGPKARRMSAVSDAAAAIRESDFS